MFIVKTVDTQGLEVVKFLDSETVANNYGMEAQKRGNIVEILIAELNIHCHLKREVVWNPVKKEGTEK
jgi:hypothetical protein